MRSDDYQPEAGESLYDDVPQWAYDLIDSRQLQAEQAAEEGYWQGAEMAFIANQLTAIEDEDPSALPGSAKQWRDYRIKVRAWIDGAVSYPEIVHRPIRPS
jgi:hypothetical protein